LGLLSDPLVTLVGDEQPPWLPPLPPSYHWEWHQIDPAPGDGVWVPVYDGTVHVIPEPGLLAWTVALGAVLTGWRLRRR